MHKIYINDKPLIFSDVYENGKTVKSYQILSDQQTDFLKIMKRMEDKKNNGIVLLSESPHNAWHSFISNFQLTEAAGGLVHNQRDEFLLIYRKNHWDLPKGKLEYDETPEIGALREVKEECGVKELELVRPLTITFHTYTEKKKLYLKKTHWFEMTSGYEGLLKPQVEEGISEVRWMSMKQVIETVFPNTYASILEVFGKFNVK